MKKYLYIKALSDFGSRMQFIAITSLLAGMPGASYYLTAYFIARQIAGMTAAPIAGMFADLYSRRRMMIIAEWLSAVSLAMLFVTSHPYVIIAAAFFLGMTYTFFDISFRAALPDMTGGEDIIAVNALLVRFSAVISITGFAFGGMIAHLSSYKVLILFDLCTYIISAGMLMRMKWKEEANETNEGRTPPIKGNWKFIFSAYPVVMVLLPASFLYPFAASAYQYGLPLLAGDTKSPGLYNGLLWSSAAMGSLLSSFFLQKRAQLSSGLYVAALLSFAFFLVVTYSFPLSLWTLAPLLLAGFFEGRCQTYYYSLLQQIEASIRGRLFGIQSINARLGYFTGFLLTPFVAEAFAIGFAVTAVQIILAAGMLSIFIAYRRFGHS
jgi:MFS family permease